MKTCKEKESSAKDSPLDKSQVQSRRRKCQHYCISLSDKVNSKQRVDSTTDKLPIHPPSCVRRVERPSRQLQSLAETLLMARN